ncbi:MAG: hypothetical protein HQ514_10275 [Rhodospirillales bacterium]|nr:hypothetical protein [Rhodospirillales bacterium]
MIGSTDLYNSYLVSRLNARSTVLNSIAGLAASGSGNNAVNAIINGARATNDRMSVATGSKFTGEAAGLNAASASAREAASMLQAADTGLTEIGDMLAEMKILVEIITTSTNPATSSFDRSVLERDFSDLRTEIDVTARATEFNDVKLLQGDGAGGTFDVSFKVGTGQGSGDNLTISLNSALVADLSAGLASDSLVTEAGAATALTKLTAAVNGLNAIKGAVAGLNEAVFVASLNASDIASGLDSFNDQRVAVDVVIEAAQFLGQEISEQGGTSLANPNTELMRNMLKPQESRSDQGNSTSEAAPTPPPEPDSDSQASP